MPSKVVLSGTIVGGIEHKGEGDGMFASFKLKNRRYIPAKVQGQKGKTAYEEIGLSCKGWNAHKLLGEERFEDWGPANDGDELYVIGEVGIATGQLRLIVREIYRPPFEGVNLMIAIGAVERKECRVVEKEDGPDNKVANFSVRTPVHTSNGKGVSAFMSCVAWDIKAGVGKATNIENIDSRNEEDIRSWAMVAGDVRTRKYEDEESGDTRWFTELHVNDLDYVLTKTEKYQGGNESVDSMMDDDEYDEENIVEDENPPW